MDSASTSNEIETCAGKCDDTGMQTAQNALKEVAQYRCLYKARLTYSATLVTRPVPNPESTTAGT